MILYSTPGGSAAAASLQCLSPAHVTKTPFLSLHISWTLAMIFCVIVASGGIFAPTLRKVFWPKSVVPPSLDAVNTEGSDPTPSTPPAFVSQPQPNLL